MFDAREMNPAEPWDREIAEDVASECARFGQILHMHLDKASPGFVYLRMSSVEGAAQVFQLLNGRIYAGRAITVEYQYYPNYVGYFGG